ncbi:MAG: GNAT family N-acetyltransferase [Clostridia bacterium]|jgi:ribosomal protein S18 acetylase RimI-like enzyme|nr:GNAT family N-acetyltransferase [Clostridia bacterium]
MFDIEMFIDDIKVSSIEKEDLHVIRDWMQEEMRANSDELLTDLSGLDDRFLEYYMSENEFFLKVVKEGKFAGILKGRVEFRNPNDVFIWCFALDSKLRGEGVGSKILLETIKYFEDNFGIYNFYTSVVDGSKDAMEFWKKNSFVLHRVSKNYFNVEGKERDMLIYKRLEKGNC